MRLLTDSDRTVSAAGVAEHDDDSAPAGGEGFGRLECSAGLFPMRALVVTTDITGLAWRSTVKQRFINTHDTAVEATYIFPLPARAGAVACRMTIGERVIVAQLQERAQARAAYDEAIQAGHRAALTEEDRPECFTITMGNLMPGDIVTVELDLVGQLAWDEGEASWRFPLVVAPRYIPGTALPIEQAGSGQALDTDLVPDASRISPPVLLPGFPNPVQLAVEISIDPAGLPFDGARCNLPCQVVSQDDDRLHLRLDPGQRLNQDLLLRMPLNSIEASASASARFVPDTEDDRQGTLAVTVVPPRPTGERVPRDVVVLLDRSGSMRGWKMVAARRAAARLVESLDARDRVRVIAFDHRLEEAPATGELVMAKDEQRYRIGRWLTEIDANGGTKFDEPMRVACECLADSVSGRDRVIILITDGQVGNEDHILKLLKDRAAGVHIHTVGIDRAVNAGFLERVAQQYRGCCELVESEARLDAVLDRVRGRIGSPAFTDATIEASGCEPGDLAPRHHRDAWPGKPWTLLARCAAPSVDASLSVLAQRPDGSPYRLDMPIAHSTGAHLAAVWARQRLRDLEDDLTTDAAHAEELKQELISLSLQYGVLCRFTAWIAIDTAAVVNPDGNNQAVTQAVDLPDGWEDAMVSPSGFEEILAEDTDMECLMQASTVTRSGSGLLGNFGSPGKQRRANPKKNKKRSRVKNRLLRSGSGDDYDQEGSDDSDDAGGNESSLSQRISRVIEQIDRCPDDRLPALLERLQHELEDIIAALEAAGKAVDILRERLKSVEVATASADAPAARSASVELVAGLRVALAA